MGGRRSEEGCHIRAATSTANQWGAEGHGGEDRAITKIDQLGETNGDCPERTQSRTEGRTAGIRCMDRHGLCVYDRTRDTARPPERGKAIRIELPEGEDRKVASAR